MRYFKCVIVTISLLAFPFFEAISQDSVLTFRTEKIYFEASFPKELCLVNKEYTRDAFLLDYMQTISGKSMKLIGTALLCSELDNYRKEKVHLPTYSLSLFQVGVDGHFTRFLLGKRIFNKLITSFSFDENLERIQKRTNDKLSRFGDTLVKLQAQKASYSGSNVVVVNGRAQIAHKQGEPKTFNIKAATTLIHKYPFVAVVVTSAEQDKNYAGAEREALELLESVHQR